MSSGLGYIRFPLAFLFHVSSETSFLLLQCLHRFQGTERHSNLSQVFIPFSMSPFDVIRISAAVWKWFCRCPDAIGPVEDSSSDNEFFTPPTTLGRCGEDQHVSNNPDSPSAIISIACDVPRLLSPAQTARLRRRHAEVVRQLTTPPPVVRAPPSNAPLKAYQEPFKVFRPSWAP